MKHVFGFILPLLFGSSLAAAATPPREFEERISALSCEDFLTDRPPRGPGPAPAAPNGWATAGRFFTKGLDAFADHRAADEAVLRHAAEVRAYEAEVEHLNAVRRDAVAGWRRRSAELFGPGLDASLKPAAMALSARGLLLLEDTQTAAQTAGLRRSLDALALEIQAESAERIETDRREAAARLQARRSRELRFDLGDAQNTRSLVSAFLDNGPSDLHAPTADLVSRLNADPALKQFVIVEVQVARRLRALAARAENASSFEPGLKIRFENNWRALTSDRGDAASLAQLRRAALALNKPGLLSAVAPGGALARLRLLDREGVVADALVNPELELTILQAGLELIAPPAAPALPKQPSMTPPAQPDVPKKARSRSHANQIKSDIESYRREFAGWKHSWEVYKSDVARFKNATHPAYVERMRQLGEAYDRTRKARQSFVAYLSYRRPAQFANPTVAERVAAANTEAAARRLEQARGSSVTDYIREDARSRSSSTYHSSSSASSSDDGWLMYWLLYQNSLQPYYVTHPQAAHAAYLWDSAEFTRQGSSVPAAPLPADLRQEMHALNDQFAVPDLGGTVDFSLPDGTTPDFNSNFSPADFGVAAMPDAASLDFSMPDVQMPSVPDVQMPSFDAPSYDAPSYTSPSYSDNSSSYSSYSDSSSSSSSDSGGGGGGGGGE